MIQNKIPKDQSCRLEEKKNSKKSEFLQNNKKVFRSERKTLITCFSLSQCRKRQYGEWFKNETCISIFQNNKKVLRSERKTLINLFFV